MTRDAETILRAYHDRPDPAEPGQRVAFGTSGHRGSSLRRTFNEAHVRAICQAIADYRRSAGITGPLFLGGDTHALSAPAIATAARVLAGNGVEMIVDAGSPYTPTPVVSRAILRYNELAGEARQADGVVVTPSHNPPEDGGLKYNPPSGGPAEAAVTSWIERRANRLLEEDLSGREPEPGARPEEPLAPARQDLRGRYVAELASVLDMEAIAGGGLRIGVDPLGGASVDYWDVIADAHALDVEVVNREVDPTFTFMPADRDGRIRMDCSSPYAMSGLIALKDRFDVAFGLDPDADRHGIVTPGAGLMNPNHYLAVAVWYLYRNRPGWGSGAGVGKTLVSSAMIDRVAEQLGVPLVEVPVGFKWFVEGLRTGGLAFGGEESAGATFVRRDGTPWTTDKDGILLCLLAAEITVKTGRDPGELYGELERAFGPHLYERVDAPATAEEKAALARLSPAQVTAEELAGDPIVARLTRAPGNDAPIGGLKVVTRRGWFAARPSGTEDVYKIYAESFVDEVHLGRIQEEARSIVDRALRSARAAPAS